MPTDYCITDFGASPEGASCTDAFAAAFAAAADAGGGVVRVPAGRFVTGTVRLQSGVVLHLDPGAVVLGSEDPADYPLQTTRWEGGEVRSHAGLIHGEDLEAVAITGHGTIDGRGAGWWRRLRDGTLEHARPRLVNLYRCRGVRVEGVTLINSPAWTFNPVDCEDVVVDRVTVRNPADSPNTDGLNPESCRNVRITGCLVDVGDDCITIKAGVRGGVGGGGPGPCENIIVSHCTLLNGHGGVVIGSEMSGSVRGVVISNCVFEGTDRGIRIKTRRGRGGVVEDVRVSNLIMRRVWVAMTINMYYRCGLSADEAAYVNDRGPQPVDGRTPTVRNIHLSQVTARGIAGQAGVFLLGLPESPITGVTLDDVVLEATDEAGSRPERPAMVDGPLPETDGEVYAEHVRSVSLTRVRLPGRRALGLRVRSGRDVRLADVTTPAGGGDDAGPNVVLEDVEGARLRDVVRDRTGGPARVQATGSTDPAVASAL